MLGGYQIKLRTRKMVKRITDYVKPEVWGRRECRWFGGGGKKKGRKGDSDRKRGGIEMGGGNKL